MMGNERNSKEADRKTIFSDATPLECQVAGHFARKGRSSGLLSHRDGYVLKPVLEGGQGERELKFYEELEKACDPATRELKRFVPRYYGTTQLKTNKEESRWLILKNTTHGFREPCIMDVKMGPRTWDPLASQEKRLSEESKYCESKRDVGFCIPGFQVYKLSTGELVKKDREFGKTLNGETVKEALKTFLNGEFGLSGSLLLQFVGKLWKILRWFKTQTKYKFYSSSLLLVYDAAKLKQIFRNSLNYSPNKTHKPTIGRRLSLRIATGPLTPGFDDERGSSESPEGCGSGRGSGTSRDSPAGPGTPDALDDWHTVFDKVCRTHSLVNDYEKDLQTVKENYSVVLRDLISMSLDQYEVWVNVHMIDFAHVFHSNSDDRDNNYLKGLKNLVDIFEEFLTEADF